MEFGGLLSECFQGLGFVGCSHAFSSAAWLGNFKRLEVESIGVGGVGFLGFRA